ILGLANRASLQGIGNQLAPRHRKPAFRAAVRLRVQPYPARSAVSITDRSAVECGNKISVGVCVLLLEPADSTDQPGRLDYLSATGANDLQLGPGCCQLTPARPAIRPRALYRVSAALAPPYLRSRLGPASQVLTTPFAVSQRLRKIDIAPFAVHSSLVPNQRNRGQVVRRARGRRSHISR